MHDSAAPPQSASLAQASMLKQIPGESSQPNQTQLSSAAQVRSHRESRTLQYPAEQSVSKGQSPERRQWNLHSSGFPGLLIFSAGGRQYKEGMPPLLTQASGSKPTWHRGVGNIVVAHSSLLAQPPSHPSIG
jgi:hypothetical protein